MSIVLSRVWESVFFPLLQRPKRLQVAALCHKGEGPNRRFLLVTSRETKRWIIPKGWPIRGLTSNEAALQEAWEEAGVKRGRADGAPVGKYTYQKRQASGWSFPVETLVYSVAVAETSDKFPEAQERTRTWVTAQRAADMVNEPELRQIFLDQAAQGT
ncbi:NUDIX hydrolase [Sulfitobacter sp. S190]|uniref:NUDIX hydrolase n=1 Tax=Sulfitobacter sp. S190 TaxID=2867022 RepID=UPI0021A66E41|nr:NUDIX hydrolase [Sulfitobacter sp. S190]UWR21613.1 NUDIX hydrolase [Sulfitobacter sp. S190]